MPARLKQFWAPTLLVLLLVVVAGVVASVQDPQAATGSAQALTPLRPPVGTSPDAPPVSAPTATTPAPLPLNRGWKFLADPHNVGISDGWPRGGAANRIWTPVSIPNDFNPAVSPAADSGSIGWYELRFTAPRASAGRSWRIAFESVRRHARVWLNGTEIGSSNDPYSPFTLPARSLYPGGTNVLMVRVDNIKPPGSLPEDWWNWGGIVGPVSLQPAAALTLGDLDVTPELRCSYRCGDLLVQGTIQITSATPLNGRLVVSVTAPRGRKAGRTFTARTAIPRLNPGSAREVRLRAAVPRPIALWSPRKPSLYQVRLRVMTGSRVQAVQTLRVGMRAVQVRHGILYLNGHRLWLHGAAIHEDVDGAGAALTQHDVSTIVAQLKSVGANITRAHYLLSERLLDALDAAGIMVWEQPPVDHADQVLASASGRQQALGMLSATLLAARNHPSVVVDSVGNELSPTPDTTPGTYAYLSQAITLARRLNSTIPVALDIYCYPGFPVQRIYSRLNVLGISDYFGWYPGIPGHGIGNFNGLEPYLRFMHSRYARQAIAISEFGAEGLFKAPSTVKGSYAFQSNYVRETLGLVNRLWFMNGTIYWTLREFAVVPGWRGGALLPPGMKPNGIHHKGLIAYDGTKKPAFALAARLLPRQPSFVR